MLGNDEVAEYYKAVAVNTKKITAFVGFKCTEENSLFMFHRFIEKYSYLK